MRYEGILFHQGMKICLVFPIVHRSLWWNLWSLFLYNEILLSLCTWFPSALLGALFLYSKLKLIPLRSHAHLVPSPLGFYILSVVNMWPLSLNIWSPVVEGYMEFIAITCFAKAFFWFCYWFHKRSMRESSWGIVRDVGLEISLQGVILTWID